MNTPSLFRLVGLAAIWGGSFLFMRIGAPVLGPTWLMEARVGLAALFLFAISWLVKSNLHIRKHWKHYLILGFFNAALPFTLFGYAAQTLSASLLSILNATTPIFGALLGALYLRQPLTFKAMCGLALGVAGVILLIGYDKLSLQPGAGLAIAATLGAAFCYSVASTYAKKDSSVSPFRNAHGSMWAATLLLVPVVPFFPAHAIPDAGVVTSVLALGVLCSGIAFLLYFRLIADIGPASALTVTFLIPVFGILWGHLFLGEEIGWYTIAGAMIVVTGTALVTGFNPRSLYAKFAVNAR
jgi:drug/metabolite transporter (DMT)-like permease